MSLENYNHRYTLLVKGDAFTATRVMHESLQPWTIVTVETSEDTFHSRTETRLVILSPLPLERELNEWFTSDSYQGPPFPIGSLLHWSPSEAINPPTIRTLA